ncbi:MULTISPECIES: cell envelope integrity protein CreD [Pseudomonas]|uniref:Membrane protein n=1 Tax=Pseudomonas putida TaxID=303 RepID=A0A379KFE7_PSEPU|nr:MULTISPECIES: cell envelope integrity protein CreD [Pseudomonas]MBG6125838.1 inner membrane protein [Pseudomonas sp. M2]NSX20942.1 cell envelope integrity protein CreD [Pseudomonas putida]SUD66329.1 membrane protein [Pseudomonas putida]GLH30955.1 cell envelope integrity protein CreD [Pseudomonas sp. BR1R-5]HDS1747166.1 cell envelope integrity protein CreD [Pseudomonas putida]
MNKTLGFKLGTIALLILLLLIPLLMIDNLIDERQNLRDGVLHDIARSASFDQQISGPLLVVPYRKVQRRWIDKDGQSVQETSTIAGHLYFLPETFDADLGVDTELRKRGIYQARLFHAQGRLSGRFQLPERWGIDKDFDDYRFDKPFLVVGISDIRGIENALELNIDNQRLAFEAGTGLDWLRSGVHVALPQLDGQQARGFNYGFDLALQGTGQLHLLPVGRTSSVDMRANWPHPSFVGSYLPNRREIDDKGFSAHWQTSFFATNLEDALRQCASGGQCAEFSERTFGVSFIDPVDQYLKSERAIKYALLFIALTFAGFFLFEVLKNLSVHPVQYILVGVALAFFYLLLLSLSEHIGFGLAYGLSASACVSLLGFYLSHVLRSLVRGVGFAAGLAVLYAMLYGLLSAEDYALLMGSLLCFGLLGVFMVLTRRLDWARVGRAA